MSKKSLFYSLSIHFLIILSLLVISNRPDKRPVRVVNHWVVDLVSPANAQVQGGEPAKTRKRPPSYHSRPGTTKLVERTNSLEESLQVQQESPAAAQEILDFASPEPSGLDTLQRASDPSPIQTLGYRLVTDLKPRFSPWGIKYFYQNAHRQTLSFLQDFFPPDFRESFHEKVAWVEIYFSGDGSIQRIITTADSDQDFAERLEEKIQYLSLAAPSKFGLPHKLLKLKIGFDPQGQFQLRFELL